MKIISYAIWGNNPIYNEGILLNIADAARFYPGWTCRVYCDEMSPVYHKLKDVCELVPFVPVKDGDKYSWTNLLWRYRPTEENVDCIFRDADSRLSDREAKAVEAWLSSGKALHVMHDDIAHYRYPICSGMWGIRNGWLSRFSEMVSCWMQSKSMSEVYDKSIAFDELFLSEVIWPMFKYGNYLGHGVHIRHYLQPYGDNDHMFPLSEPMEFGRYVGETVGLPVEKKKQPKFFFFRKSVDQIQ